MPQGDIASLPSCDLCGQPMHPGKGRTPRKRHDDCRLFLCYVRAAAKKGEAIGPDLAAAELIAAANRIRGRLWEHGEGGRFSGKRRAPRSQG